MKKILIMAAFTLCIGSMIESANAAPCDMSYCASSINGDAGHTSKRCDSPGGNDGCSCTPTSQACAETKFVVAGGSCGTGWMGAGNAIDGRKCCVKNCSKTPEEMATHREEVRQAINDANLDEVFGDRANAYYGFVDGTNRSPSDGRGNSVQAKLDACLHHLDVDAIPGADNSEKWTNCVGNTYGCGNTTNKNEYCQATGTNDGVSVSAAVCKDRCDCFYGQGTCAGL